MPTPHAGEPSRSHRAIARVVRLADKGVPDIVQNQVNKVGDAVGDVADKVGAAAGDAADMAADGAGCVLSLLKWIVKVVLFPFWLVFWIVRRLFD